MKQIEVWNNIAEHWSKFRVRIPPTVEKFIENKTGKILDVGCGSGRNFKKVEGLNWSGVDFSEKMIEFSKAQAKINEMEVELKVADSTELPFEDKTFDVVLCYAVIHCVEGEENRRKTLEEIYRVLKPCGEALISGWGFKSPRLKNREKESFIPWTIRDGEGKQLRYTYIYDLDEMVELCKSVGFEIVSSFEERNVNVIVRRPKD